MKTYILLSLAFIGIAFSGCSKRPAQVGSEQQNGQPTGEPAISRNHLPIARYPTAKLEIEKPNERKCSVWVDFSRWPNTPVWNRLECGIHFISYDARIEYLGHSAKGDRYRITVLQPYKEGEKHVEAVPVAYDAEIDYLGGDQKVFEVSGVSFTLRN